MASIYERKNKQTGVSTWQAQVRRKGYPPSSQNFATEQLAKDWATKIEAGVLNNAPPPTRQSIAMTIPEVIDWYIPHPTKPRKCETKKHINRLHFLKEEFAHFTVQSLSTEVLSKWISKRQKINADSTINHYYVALKNALMHHARIHDYPQNLFNQIKCKSASNQRDRRFSIEETAQLFKAVNLRSRVHKKEFKVTVLFALETGCRIGEMLKLKWNEVSIANREIRFLKNTTKTKQERKIGITTVAQKILKWIEKNHNPTKRKDKRVFEFFTLDDHQLSRKFKQLCEKAGIENPPRWHDLRHEATSRFYEKAPNLNDMEIAQITGHASLVSLKRYAHLRPSSIIKKLW